MGYILANILFFGQLRNIPHVGFELYGLGRRTCCIMGPLPGASDYVVGEGGGTIKNTACRHYLSQAVLYSRFVEWRYSCAHLARHVGEAGSIAAEIRLCVGGTCKLTYTLPGLHSVTFTGRSDVIFCAAAGGASLPAVSS